MLDVCLQMNIQCVSAYAFSIENFKRPPDEVDALMTLAEEKLLDLCNKGCACSTFPPQLYSELIYACLRDLLDRYGVRLNIIGRVELLPKNVQDAVRKAEKLTRYNDRCAPLAYLLAPLLTER